MDQFVVPHLLSSSTLWVDVYKVAACDFMVRLPCATIQIYLISRQEPVFLHFFPSHGKFLLNKFDKLHALVQFYLTTPLLITLKSE